MLDAVIVTIFRLSGAWSAGCSLVRTKSQYCSQITDRFQRVKSYQFNPSWLHFLAHQRSLYALTHLPGSDCTIADEFTDIELWPCVML